MFILLYIYDAGLFRSLSFFFVDVIDNYRF